ncbi:YkvA family protein [Aureimonas sp. ME7]|uniref:YkvA family protein n=1 Tax=Aureimonas sp. ME7 TaxID=2744252 RepID=UPI0015F4A10A|nr:YkvA family protein [Aureimonas sp. ME7]
MTNPSHPVAAPSDVAAGASLPAQPDEALIGEILLPGDEREQARQETRVRKGFFSTLKRAARHIPFVEDVVASYHCALDPETPTASRGILLAALAYFVLPIDVIPDFIVGLGFTDDAAVLLAAFSAVQKNIRPEHYERARQTLSEDGEPAPRAAS